MVRSPDMLRSGKMGMSTCNTGDNFASLQQKYKEGFKEQ